MTEAWITRTPPNKNGGADPAEHSYTCRAGANLGPAGALTASSGPDDQIFDQFLTGPGIHSGVSGPMVVLVDTADIAALDGRHVVAAVRDYLAGASAVGEGVRILTEPPLRWVSPGVLRLGDCAPARHRLLLWTTRWCASKVIVGQDGKIIARKTVRWPASPGRMFRIPSAVLDGADAHGGPITVSFG